MKNLAKKIKWMGLGAFLAVVAAYVFEFINDRYYYFLVDSQENLWPLMLTCVGVVMVLLFAIRFSQANSIIVWPGLVTGGIMGVVIALIRVLIEQTLFALIATIDDTPFRFNELVVAIGENIYPDILMGGIVGAALGGSIILGAEVVKRSYLDWRFLVPGLLMCVLAFLLLGWPQVRTVFANGLGFGVQALPLFSFVFAGALIGWQIGKRQDNEVT